MANLAAIIVMSVIFLVVTLAHYVIPIVIVGSIAWVVLVFSLRGRRAVAAEPGVVAQPEPMPGATAGRARQRDLAVGTG